MSGYRQPMTLDRVKDRCNECGDCLEWCGPTNGAGQPKIAWMDENGRTHRAARRVVWEIAKGHIPSGKLVTVTCENVRCLNPAHLKLTTKAEVARKTNDRAAVKLKRRISSARTNQAKFGKITMEIARAIRASEKTGVDWARELNCSVSLVSKVRQNRSWMEPANPFSGLGSRA